MNILIAEDEEDILMLLKDELQGEAYNTFTALDGQKAFEIFKEEEIDLALLDVMMPKIDGFNLLNKIRETSDIPVIFLTARGEEMDRVLGLNLGADDYLVKPFSMAELKARILVQKRRMNKDKKSDNAEILKCGDIILDKGSGCLFKSGKEVVLNAKEYLLICYLMENSGRVLTKKQLYNAVWEESYAYDDNTIMVHISHIRNKIEDDPKNPKYLLTFRGIGYKFAKIN